MNSRVYQHCHNIHPIQSVSYNLFFRQDQNPDSYGSVDSDFGAQPKLKPRNLLCLLNHEQLWSRSKSFRARDKSEQGPVLRVCDIVRTHWSAATPHGVAWCGVAPHSPFADLTDVLLGASIVYHVYLLLVVALLTRRSVSRRCPECCARERAGRVAQKRTKL